MIYIRIKYLLLLFFSFFHLHSPLSMELLRMTSCGYQSGLNILINLDPDDYHSSIVESVGTKVTTYLYHPQQIKCITN